MNVVSSAEMRRIEAEADAGGHTYAEMMRRAGSAVARAIADRFEVARVLVLAGPGNNGGDGLVAARELSDQGFEVNVYTWKRDWVADPLADALTEREVPNARREEDGGLAALTAWLAEADVVVDALLGTGLSRPLAGDLPGMLDALAAAVAGPRRPVVVAVDLPTGMSADDGALDPHTVPADLTVTFGFPKVGQFRFPGAAAVGELVIDEIGIPRGLASGGLHLAMGEEVARLAPDRPLDAHKGTFGQALIIAGSVDFTGAAGLAALGAYRAGAGLVTVGLPRAIHPVVAGLVPEATFVPLPDADGRVTADAATAVAGVWAHCDAALLGPGLTDGLGSLALVRRLLEHGPGPARLVVDADGLNLLAQTTDWPGRLPPSTVLTPHPGEMGRLLGTSSAVVNADRVATARDAAGGWGHVVVLKGAFTVVAAPDGRVSVNPFATPALATAGSGDVLAGLIVGLLAQGLTPFDAAVLGTWLHGQAGQHLADTQGARGTLARDVLGQIGAAWASLAEAAG
jgi:ADP-dependent NAD(P)H-hydrate dehydratase / NAD(P)H-hydrate epimerase